MVTVINKLIFKIKSVHDLSYHPIGLVYYTVCIVMRTAILHVC